MHSISSEILLWQEGGRLWLRITTNVSQARLEAKLQELGVAQWIETIGACPPERNPTGRAFCLRCWEGVTREQLAAVLK